MASNGSRCILVMEQISNNTPAYEEQGGDHCRPPTTVDTVLHENTGRFWESKYLKLFENWIHWFFKKIVLRELIYIIIYWAESLQVPLGHVPLPFSVPCPFFTKWNALNLRAAWHLVSFTSQFQLRLEPAITGIVNFPNIFSWLENFQQNLHLCAKVYLKNIFLRFCLILYF